jgi:TIP49 P-loop domain
MISKKNRSNDLSTSHPHTATQNQNAPRTPIEQRNQKIMSNKTIEFRNNAKDVAKLERIGAHSHIQGLGLNDLLEVQDHATLVGQTKARRALGILCKLIRSQTVAGRAVLLAGPPSVRA